MGQVILFALETAMRQGELAGMTGDGGPEETDGDASGNEKRPEENRSTLFRCRGNPQGTTEHPTTQWERLGYWPGRDFQDFAKACREKGISGLHFHDLRHEGTSRLFEQGFDTMEVRTITGHKTLQMLARYTLLRAEDLVERMK